MDAPRKKYVKLKFGDGKTLYMSNRYNAKFAEGAKRSVHKGGVPKSRSDIHRVDITGIFHGTSDDIPSKSLPAWRTAADDIDNAFKRSDKVWLHCVNGKSRTTYVATAYLIRHRQMQYEAAKSTVWGQLKGLHDPGASPDIADKGLGTYHTWSQRNQAFLSGSSDEVVPQFQDQPVAIAQHWQMQQQKERPWHHKVSKRKARAEKIARSVKSPIRKAPIKRLARRNMKKRVYKPISQREVNELRRMARAAYPNLDL